MIERDDFRIDIANAVFAARLNGPSIVLWVGSGRQYRRWTGTALRSSNCHSPRFSWMRAATGSCTARLGQAQATVCCSSTPMDATRPPRRGNMCSPSGTRRRRAIWRHSAPRSTAMAMGGRKSNLIQIKRPLVNLDSLQLNGCWRFEIMITWMGCLV